MKKYLDQLIEDLHEAAKNLPPKPNFDLPDELIGLEGVIEWENCERKPMQDWIGITKQMFPPTDQLNEGQLKTIVKEILKLWEAYNFHPVLPKNLPAKYAYKILVNHFDKPTEWVSEGIVGIEFCSYETENCPFPSEYCMCNDMRDMNKQFEDIGNYKELNKLKREIRFLEHKSWKNSLMFVLHRRKVKKISQRVSEVIKNIQEKPDHQILQESFLIHDFDDVQLPYTLEMRTGIFHKEFPRCNQLNTYQIRKILIDVLELLNLLKVKVRFYNDLPIELKYQYLVDSWIIEPIQILTSSETEWDELPVLPDLPASPRPGRSKR